MGQAQAAARHQQRVEELCAAAIRALAGVSDLHFRGRRLHRGRRRLPFHAPHLHPSLDVDDFASFRGAADGLALRVKLSDAALHARLAPPEAIERALFDLLEQFRVESLAGVEHPGVRRNLRHRFEQWSLAFQHAGLADSERGVLLYTVAQMARSRVSALPVVEDSEDLIETTRGQIAAAIGGDLAGLRRQRHDQAAYAPHALAIASRVAAMIDGLADEPRGADSDEHRIDQRLVFGLLDPHDGAAADDDGGDDDAGTGPTGGHPRAPAAHDAPYCVFTTAYDRELRAASRVRRALLDEHRERLDRLVAGQGLNIARLARELQALLATPQRDDWADGQEEGLIDGRRLAQLVASPAEWQLFRQPLREPVAQAVVVFLLDCSGSMKAHIESVATMVDAFARALELAGAASEILGFTTGAWHGGRALRDWQRAGRPAHPGRLNEVDHLVFKDADTPWRRARREIAALLEPRHFREGIDGEALTWAASRLAARAEPRKLLISISDGCPMDGATELANPPQLLDRHLREVASAIEEAGAIELLGIGVGLDLSPYYGRCQQIDLSAGLGNRVFHEIVAMIGGRRQR